MNALERFRATLNYEEVDRAPLVEPGLDHAFPEIIVLFAALQAVHELPLDGVSERLQPREAVLVFQAGFASRSAGWAFARVGTTRASPGETLASSHEEEDHHDQTAGCEEPGDHARFSCHVLVRLSVRNRS